jgi:nitronate monooxygenase
VVAAGGIATPQRLAELLAHGADAVRIGTCFLACPEAQAHPDYVANLIGAANDDTVLTEWFDDDGRWPNAPHRVLGNALRAARRSGWRSTKPPSRNDTRPTSDMAQYAGTGVGTLTSIQPVETVLRHLVGAP